MENNNSLPEELVSKHLEEVWNINISPTPLQISESAASVTIDYMGRFAEWVVLKGFVTGIGANGWYYKDGKTYTTPQLIDLFFSQSK